MSGIDLSKVNLVELVAESDRRKKQNSLQSNAASTIDDYMSPIGDSALTPNHQACEDAKKIIEDEEKFNEQVLEHQRKVVADMARMEDEFQEAKARHEEFAAECDRRIQATSTTEQLSLFPWNRH